MSTYTTQLRWIVERLQHQNHSDPDDYTACYQALGLSDYPIFDENYRQTLNDKIIRHYYFREIGFETSAQFAFFMRRTMHEHMPYFNKLYLSDAVIIDPITNRKYTWGETFSLAQTGGTLTENTSGGQDSETHNEMVTDTLAHGEVVDTEKGYGRTETDTTTFGKTVDGTKETEFGKTYDSTSTTTFGRTQETVNGGKDTMLEGATHERDIKSDTPMNQITNQGVESLNYATEVTYIDREGQTASETDYGGTTNITNGGSDTTTAASSDGGAENVETSRTEGGTESVTKALGGEDTVQESHSGSDVRTIETHGGKSGTHSESGSSEFARDLDEQGERSHNVSGYDGMSPSDLLMKWRETFLNIDMQVIESLNTLFFGLWN